MDSNLKHQGDKFGEHLDSFKSNVQTIVDDWMKHYCNAVGITDPTLFSRPTSRADSRSRGLASRKRMVKSSMDYTTGLLIITWSKVLCVYMGVAIMYTLALLLCAILARPGGRPREGSTGVVLMYKLAESEGSIHGRCTP
jgi:hypothetical protein